MDWVTQVNQWMYDKGLEDYPNENYESKKIESNINAGDEVILSIPDIENFNSYSEFDEYKEYFKCNKKTIFTVKSVKDNIVTLDSGFKTHEKNIFDINDNDIPF